MSCDWFVFFIFIGVLILCVLAYGVSYGFPLRKRYQGCGLIDAIGVSDLSARLDIPRHNMITCLFTFFMHNIKCSLTFSCIKLNILI